MKTKEKPKQDKCSRCNVNECASTLHTCPYQCEINYDDETLCDCCDECKSNCSDDI